MAHFEAYFNFMIVGITNKYVFNLKFTEILQTDVQERLEGKSIQNSLILEKFFRSLSYFVWHCFYMKRTTFTMNIK